MAANHQQTYKMDVSMQQLQSIICSNAFVVQLDLDFKSENPSPTGVWYRLHHGVSFTSWGEKITITLTPLGPMSTQVVIHSECGMPTQVIDWGKNKQIVRNVYEYLAANIRQFPLQAPVQPVQQPAEATPPRFCSQCGQPITGQGNFCVYCGYKLR